MPRLPLSDVDAVFLLSDGILLEQKGVGRIIWSTKQAPTDWKMRAELFGRGDFVDANPDIAAWSPRTYPRRSLVLAAGKPREGDRDQRARRSAAQRHRGRI